jgi:hypothetical protein
VWTDGLDEFEVGGFFDEVTAGARVEGAPQVGDVVVHGEHEDPSVGADAADFGGRGDAVAVGESEVHDEDVGMGFSGEGDGLFDRASLPNDLEVFLGVEDAAQSAPHDGVVVAKRDPHDVSHGAPRRARSYPPRAGK